MTKINWYYPKTLSEASNLVSKSGVIPIGGGTDLVKRPLRGISGIVSLRDLDLGRIGLGKENWFFGSMCSYADVLNALRPEQREHVLFRSLEYAANTPCRNRITLGGSTAFVPGWSDLAGPLLVLDAFVHLAADPEERYSFTDYLQQPDLRKGKLITGISFRNSAHRAAHYREVRTHNDMPQFTVTVLLRMRDSRIDEARLILVGSRERFLRLQKTEAALIGKNAEEIKHLNVQELEDIRFHEKPGTDAEYLRERAAREILRSVLKALGDKV